MSSDSGADIRLASYGSLAPGKVNHNQLSALTGHWRPGIVRGRLLESGWGTALGFPGLVLDPQGADVDVSLFESHELPDHWSRLDEFEGSDYRRVITQVRTADGHVNAFIYVAAERGATK